MRDHQRPPAIPNRNQQPQQINVDITGKTPSVCVCGNDTFRPAIQLYVISAIMSPTGQEIIAQNGVLACCKCEAAFKKP
jgi:hypothetical protein